jgi:solute carrier family 25 S-adenosylmethionine transporter 26
LTSSTINFTPSSVSPIEFPRGIPSQTSSLLAKSKPSTGTEAGGFTSGLISGATSRATKELLLHPVDTVRARLQLDPALRARLNYTETEIWTKDLYDGVTPALVAGIPAGALFFAVKDSSKVLLRSAGLGRNQATILSVGLTNLPYWLLRGPAEVLKTRSQAGLSGRQGAGDALGDMVRESGYRDTARQLYAPYWANVAYAAPADVVKFLAYEVLQQRLYGIAEGQKVKGVQGVVCGGLAGLVAQACTTPLDVARTRVMTRDGLDIGASSSSSGDSAGDGVSATAVTGGPGEVLSTLAEITDKEGPAALFAGVKPRMVRAVGSGAIQFATYEYTQNLFR